MWPPLPRGKSLFKKIQPFHENRVEGEWIENRVEGEWIACSGKVLL
jgi:hypothetical protein